MSDGKRRRFRKNKLQQEEKRPVILAKRDIERNVNSGNGAKAEEAIQPKILIKTKPVIDKETPSTSVKSSSNASASNSTSAAATHDATAPSPLQSGQSPNTVKESAETSQPQLLLHEPAPQMTRPATVISSTLTLNANARKFLLKSNNDFLVVGIVGTQGVGKSTIMNLLANDDPEYDYYTKVFKEEDSIFPIKMKTQKCPSCSRTESTHLFITKDRMILIDTPPLLGKSHLKDMTSNELDDMRSLIMLFSVCHLVIVVQDDYFNIGLMRLLQFAELTKPNQDNKPFVTDYFPNILFVKNRAKREDYIPSQKERMDKMIQNVFKSSQLKIFLGQTGDRHKKTKNSDNHRIVNSLLIPDVKGRSATPYHQDLDLIVEEFRNTVYMTPRNQMYNGSTEFTEGIWFELLMKVSSTSQHFFFNVYEDIHRKHLDVGNSKDNHDMWSSDK